MPYTFPFYVVAAFAKGPFQGNPAAVVFIDDVDLEKDTLAKMSVNFNQPMTSVVGSQIPSADEKVAAFNIRWFAMSTEVPLCGHALMAAARAIFERDLVADSVQVIEFARRIGKDVFEIRLPAATVLEAPAEDRPKVRAAITKAFGRDVAIKFIGVGAEGFKGYLLVELEEHENLGQCKVDANAFLETEYMINVITTASESSGGDELFVSRMFSPSVLPASFPEDAVCGSAHCLLVPYWHKKKGLIADQPFSAKQVSARGGDLGLFLDQNAGNIGLRGETFVMAEGQLHI
ncbi:hypothetical protein GGX14DRAFT_536246 [Mycena pura]|uniref:Diaminopimelate epimerase-like protein n=1 Tax=Mycena pura TaxID=153505 RepID=A0AAD6V384_9AGAR|nr:hypothetical protein GGX14DRAFT_536246 [Mycena pura]